MAYHGKTRGTVAREKFDIIAENLYMDKWGSFVFNEPYIGNEIKQINNVVLPKQYLEFMKKHNGGQGDIGETWLELFTLENLQEIKDDYCIRDFLPDHIIIGSNGNGELYGIDSDGVYFNVPAIMDEDDVTVLGDDINLLPDKINNFWK